MDKTVKSVSVQYTLIVFVITLFNLLTIGKLSNLALTTAEVLVVLFFIAKGKLDKALLYHLLFIITCVSSTNASGLMEDSLKIYSYARLKLYGPVGLSYIITIFIFAIVLFRRRGRYKRPNDSSLFSQLFRIISILGATGIVMGIWGLLTDVYWSGSQFINYSVYIFVVIMTIYSMISLRSSSIIKEYYNWSLPVLIGGVFATFLAFSIYGITTTYGGLSGIILQADSTYFAIILLLAISSSKSKSLIVSALALYFYIITQSSIGKNIVIVFMGLFIFLYLIFFTSNKQMDSQTIKRNRRNKRLAFALISICLVVLSSFNYGSLFLRKLDEFSSIFSGNLDSVSDSPYIRISSFLNIIDNNLTHPIKLLFGQGYGGYFTDSLHLFNRFTFEGGAAWSAEVVSSGRFTSAHDTFAVVPLLNGLVGLYLIFRISFRYAKKIRTSYLSFAAIPWLFLTFYFNTQLALTGAFLLYASECEAE